MLLVALAAARFTQKKQQFGLLMVSRRRLIRISGFQDF
jgi:hypothetical protein